MNRLTNVSKNYCNKKRMRTAYAVRIRFNFVKRKIFFTQSKKYLILRVKSVARANGKIKEIE